MANSYITRPEARFHAWRNNFVTYVNGHLGRRDGSSATLLFLVPLR